MKLTKAFVVSDIHGQYDHIVELLQHWDRETQKLLILGDMIDRGKDSLKVVQEVMKLKQLYGNQVILLKGNHEDMLLNFLDEPGFDYGELFFRNGGNTTAWEFADDEHLMFKSYAERAELIKQRKDEINFIRNTRDYYDFGEVLFVHAGIDPYLSDWRKTDTHKFYWNRGWWNHKNETGKTIVYGHTPTQLIHNDKSNDIWIDEANKYINIDGGCVFGGQLNGIVIDNEGNLLEKYAIK